MPSSAGTEAGAAMEITVSKANLLKELTATQGVGVRQSPLGVALQRCALLCDF